MSTPMQHWTNKTYADFVYRIASDFVSQIEEKLEAVSLDRSDYARLLGVGVSRVSQVFNNPGNLRLETMVRCARALGMKLAIVAYEDGDSANSRGPVNSQIFAECWKKSGMPRDFFDLGTPPSIREVASTHEAVNTDYRFERVNLERSAATTYPTVLRG